MRILTSDVSLNSLHQLAQSTTVQAFVAGEAAWASFAGILAQGMTPAAKADSSKNASFMPITSFIPVPTEKLQFPTSEGTYIQQLLELWQEILQLLMKALFPGKDKDKQVPVSQVASTNGFSTQGSPTGAFANLPTDASWVPIMASTSPRAAIRLEHQEQEQTRVGATGTVHTSDGRSISFQLSMNLERSDRLMVGGSVQLRDPLVLNTSATSARLAGARINFDLDGDGKLESMPTLGSGSGFLVFDRNGDGLANDGTELFGVNGNGFTDLAALDSDHNGWIDESDAAFSALRVWHPGSSDSASNPSGSSDSRSSTPASNDPGSGPSWSSLAELHIGALYIGSTNSPFLLRDGDGSVLGNLRATGIYMGEDGHAGSLQQVDLATEDE